MPLDQPPSALEKFGHDARMTFGEHIEELRRRLIYALVGILVAAVGTFYFAFDIIGWIAQPFVQALDAMGFPPSTFATDATLGFGVYMRVALIGAAVIASPWVIYQLWVFVVEGLYEHERRTVHILAPFSVTMTVLAILFTRYILLPVSLVFFIQFATLYPKVEVGEPGWMLRMLIDEEDRPGADIPDEATSVPGQTERPATIEPLNLPTLDADPAAPREGDLWINRRDGKVKAFFNGHVRILATTTARILTPLPVLGDYIRFATLVGLGNIIAFQLPVAMLIAGWLGIVPPEDVARLRKYAFFGCAVLAAVLTPADIVSMTVLMLPLYLLFEFGLLLMRIVYKEPVWSDGEGGGPE